MARFPDISPNLASGEHNLAPEDSNAAIQVFGRRFHKDQTPVEYLAEFLLVFASPKGEVRSHECSFPIYDSVPTSTLSYHPPYRLSLKLFAFLGASKLETRHPVHILSFKKGIAEIERRINPGSTISRDDAVRLVQGLFSGFVGVAGDRTWTAHTFLPASGSLLAREVLWKHGGSSGALKRPDLEWDQAWSGNYFNTTAHSFMARGGEVLYLQLTSLFNSHLDHPVAALLDGDEGETYEHLNTTSGLRALRDSLQAKLADLLRQGDQAIGPLGEFVARAFKSADVDGEDSNPKVADLGWVLTETAAEACLFAWEAENICKAQHSGLQKISLLKDLCVLQVMRSLCFQSARVTGARKIPGFAGGYAWVACPPSEMKDDNTKKLAINAYDAVESLLYKSLRSCDLQPPKSKEKEQWLDDGDDNVLRLFRKIGKQIGIIVPRKGTGMRITLPSHIVRLLVAALIPPGKRMRLDLFYERIFSHFGIAINQDFVGVALAAYEMQHGATGFGIGSSWFEEELRRGGYLIPLSDAVALVINPYKG